jgi:hypothetical protein
LDNHKIISCRKNVVAPAISNPRGLRFEAENIDHIRFDYTNTYPRKIRIEAYEDFIIGNNASANGWDPYGEYALQMDLGYAQAHFDPGLTSPAVDGKWPRYNDVSGLAYTTKWKNYREKFDNGPDPDTLSKAIRQYFINSKIPGNYTGSQTVPNPPVPNGVTMPLNYLDILRLVALDYHVARMMGLGEIDVRVNGPGDTSKVMHLAHYRTINSKHLDIAGLPDVVDHLYLTLPTQLKDYRMPVVPVLDEFTYGITVDNGTGVPQFITDYNGYSLYDDSRYIKLNKGNYLLDVPAITFPPTTNFFLGGPPEFDLSKVSRPILYGIEYKGEWESNFRDEKLSSDPDFLDDGGKEEVVPIIDQLNPFFIHQETESGKHDYAIYGINALARTSALSNVRQTDETEFIKRNHLLPPFNFRGQLIQKEDVLIFTSENEQTMLANISTGDKTLVRATFDWNHNHNAAYQFADKIEFYFQSEAPLIVRGKVASVTDLSDGLAAVYTTSYDINSTTNVQTIIPEVQSNDVVKFMGAFLSNGERQFQIVDVFPGVNPTFIIKRIKQGELSEVPPNSGQMSTAFTYIKPEAESIFFVAQNMSTEASWQSKLAKVVDLYVLDSNNPYFEPQLETDGTITQVRIGGITASAEINEIFDADPWLPANTPTGIFEVVFPNNPLPGISDPDVSFYGGKIRIEENNSTNKKVLEVFDINITGVLKLKIFDPSFAYDYPNGPFINDYVPIKTGVGVNVNFHPSYKVYLKVDQPNSFDQAHILPAINEETRETFLGARAIDTTTSNPLFTSVITPPSLIIARNIQEPVQPGPPEGPVFATRPDYYGKSTYTFQTQFDVTAGREPYSMIFYRAMDRTILFSIYKQATVEQILADLVLLSGAELSHTTERWLDLIRGNYDGSTNLFYQYEVYQFPLPDNDLFKVKGKNGNNIVDVFPFTNFTDLNSSVPNTANLNASGTGNLKVIDFVVLAISDAFLPMTEEPVLYRFIRESNNTSPKPPKYRDENGNLIPPQPVPNASDYEPWPMVTKIPNSPGLVRFTDYTLDGASTKSKFFYFAVEMSNTLSISEPSEILGPISLINAYPADPPEIRSILTQLANDIAGIPTGVKLSINDYIESEYIKKIQLYRTTNISDAKSVRTMSLVDEFDVATEIVDEFNDLTVPPYGSDIFYRLVALREIPNELSQPGNPVVELIPSLPSALLKARVVDVKNPAAPEIIETHNVDIDGNFTDVILQWEPTAYNAKYYLYKMTASGNWMKIHETGITNDPQIIVELDNLNIPILLKEDDNGMVYHRFKVTVENSSGLLNLDEWVLTI